MVAWLGTALSAETEGLQIRATAETSLRMREGWMDLPVAVGLQPLRLSEEPSGERPPPRWLFVGLGSRTAP